MVEALLCPPWCLQPLQVGETRHFAVEPAPVRGAKLSVWRPCFAFSVLGHFNCHRRSRVASEPSRRTSWRHRGCCTRDQRDYLCLDIELPT